MCVGFSHSGKTTFARKLAKELPGIVNTDNDDIATFLNAKYPVVVFSKYNKKKRTFKTPGLKFLIFKTLFKFCLKAGLSVIHSSGNINKDARSFISKTAKRHGYKLITIYFNLPKKVILKRIKNSKKNKNIFIWSKTWLEALAKQERMAELPPSKKNTIYFEVKNNIDLKRVFSKVKNLLKYA